MVHLPSPNSIPTYPLIPTPMGNVSQRCDANTNQGILQHCQSILERNLTGVNALALGSRNFQDLSQCHLLIQDLKRLQSRLSEETPYILMLNALFFFVICLFNSCMMNLNELLELRRNHAEALHLRMVVSQTMHNWQRCLADCNALIEKGEIQSVAPYKIKALYALQMWHQLSELCSYILQRNPQDYTARFYRIHASCKLSQWKSVVSDSKILLEQLPDNVEITRALCVGL